MDKAKLVIEDDKLRVWEFEQSEPEFSAINKEPFGSPKVIEIEVETDGVNDQHPGVLNAFSDHILYGSALVAEGAEGINGLMISNAAHLSSWTNETVSIPIDEDRFHSILCQKIASSKAKEDIVSTVNEDMSSTF